MQFEQNEDRDSKVEEIFHYYSAFLLKCYPSLKPAPFSHEIVVCTGRACAGEGNHELLQNLKRRLDIQKNGISSDGKVFLRTVNCLRNCRTAPNILVDGVLYSGKTMDEIIKIVNAEFPD